MATKMTFDNFWDKLLRGSGGKILTNNATVSMTVEEFRRLMRVSYESGVTDGKSSKSKFEKIFGKIW